MQRLLPIASKETRHLFVDPAIVEPWCIEEEGYTNKETTSYIKPGKVPNLMMLCKPEGVRFSITEEPDMDKLIVDSILIGAYDIHGDFRVFSADFLNNGLGVRLTRNGAIGAKLKGLVGIDTTGMIGIDGQDVEFRNDELYVDIDLTYSRGSRCLEYTNMGTFDNKEPIIYGITLSLTHKDSKIV